MVDVVDMSAPPARVPSIQRSQLWSSDLKKDPKPGEILMHKNVHLGAIRNKEEQSK